ncbi:MAG: S41 family peptidase [Hyphomicrobiales bacterium]
MRKTITSGIGFMAVGALAATIGWHVVGPLNAATSSNADTYRHLNLFGDVFDRIRSDYVEKPDEEKLVDAAVSGMLASLDPHSSYMNPKNFRDMQVQTRGEFGGLGIEVTMENGVVKVVSPIDDTPAARAGMLAGDLITHLDGEQITGLTLSQAVDKMRGKVNTPIVLTVVRKGREKPFEVKIIRDIIRIRAVRSSIEGDDVGYIRITTFNEQTQENLNVAFDKISKEGGDKIKGYIIDLRNNPGGLLDQAISVSDTFLDRGEIVSTRGRNAEETQRFSAQAGDLAKGKDLIVLINGGSASASEIVAGALQDHQRATLLGTRSFGKGSVQTIIPLGAFGAMRLTTARYYTPSGRSIQAKGISPDIKVEQELPDELKEQNVKTRGEANLRGHLKNEDGKKKSGSEDKDAKAEAEAEAAAEAEKKKKEEDSGSSAYVPREKEKDQQLQYALNLLRGIKVNENTKSEDSAAAPKKVEEEKKEEKEGAN